MSSTGRSSVSPFTSAPAVGPGPRRRSADDVSLDGHPEGGPRPSSYRWRTLLLVSVGLAGLVLSLQFPANIYSPDVAFHAAKITRAAGGEFFIDPFTGTPTIYPSLFHFCFGLLKRVLNLDSLQTIRLIVVTDFVGLFAALYYLARAFFPDPEEASLYVLSVPLVFSSPTGRNILLAQPSCFAYVFLILGLGALYRYLGRGRPIHLALGGLLLGLAASIWWTNVFVVTPVVLLLGGVALVRGPRPSLAQVMLFAVTIGLPWAYTAWELWSVRAILPYLSRPPAHAGVVGLLVLAMTTFLTKGNLQFTEFFYFWDLSKAPLATSGLPVAVRLLNSLASIVHYFVLVLPFNLALAGYTLWMVVRNRALTMADAGLVRTLPWVGLLILLFSAGTPDSAHMRRVQFIVYLLWLLFAFKTLPSVVGSARTRRALAAGVCAASLVSLAFTAVYSARLFASGLPPTDRALVDFIGARPDHDEERIFMLGDSLRRVAPFVGFRSFVDLRHGLYYWQDPVTAGRLYGDFVTIKEKGADWRTVLRERGIRLMVFRLSAPDDLAVFRQYQDAGVIRFQNRDWVVLEIPT
jgi:hypothetical protein